MNNKIIGGRDGEHVAKSIMHMKTFYQTEEMEALKVLKAAYCYVSYYLEVRTYTVFQLELSRV